MQARTGPPTQEAAKQLSAEASKAIRATEIILSRAKLDALRDRASEKDMTELLQQAEQIGKECANYIGRTQMMNIVGQLRGLGNSPTMAQISLFRAYLAYQVAKERKLETLQQALKPWFDQITRQWERVRGAPEQQREEWTRRAFSSFVYFVDSIVAYYTYHAKGGAE